MPMDLETEERWKEIIGRFAGKVAMTSCLTDDAGAHPNFCYPDRYPLCAAIRENPDAATFICGRVNVAMLAVVTKTLRPGIEICDAGMLRLAVPIVRDGVLVGQVVACGLASDDEDVEIDTFGVSLQLDLPEEDVMKLTRSTPVGSEAELELHAQQLFELLNPRG